ncbi:MAG: DUF4340 domain-containing protein [Gemmatimonadota bacterium]
MRLKTNLIISAIFLALLAFVYFYEIKGGEERRSEAQRAKQLLDFGDHEVTRFTILRHGFRPTAENPWHGDSTVVVEKTPDRWEVRAPAAVAADQDAVERYLRSLRETEVERVIEDSAAMAGEPARRARYGLEPPRLEVLVELADGPQDTVALGADTPTAQYTYGRRSGPNPEIFAVRAWRFDNLDKGLFDLRDRRVLAFEREAVQEIRLERSWEEAPVVIARQPGGGWRLTSPVAAAADEGAVSGILSRLQNGKAERFAAEQPGDAEVVERGLAPEGALIRLSLLVGEDRAEKRLTIGYEEGGGAHFARDASRPAIFTVDSTLVNQLRKPLFDLRDRRPLRLDRERVRGLRLSRPGREDVVAERDSAGAWQITAPEARPGREWAINSVLNDLDGIEVVEFVASADPAAAARSFGLAAPRLTVVLRLADGSEMEARFGDEDAGRVYLARGADIFLAPASVVGDLDQELEDLAEPPSAGSDSIGAVDGAAAGE